MALPTRVLPVAVAVANLLLMIAPAEASDEEQGAELAATCAACHGPAGTAQGIPSLAGLDERRIIDAMAAYKTNERPDHIMHAVALSLSDDEIKRVARYLAQHQTEAKPK
jgi:sulfide dehydrogenase cytochrome subunit